MTMEKVIYKYTLPFNDGSWQNVFMPEEAKIIHIGVQGKAICLWAIVEPLADKEERHFQIVGTGEMFYPVKYIGTVQVLPDDYFSGETVLHVFERGQGN